MLSEETLVIFSVGEMRVGLPASCVDRVVFACEVAPLPNAPSIVLGVIDFHGTLAPVFDMNARFGLPSRGVQVDNYFIICNTPRRKTALLVEQVQGVEPYEPATVVPSEQVLPGLDYIQGITRVADDMIIVQDLARFLSIDEEAALQAALDQQNSD